MPAATTHIEFARDVYNRLDSDTQKKIDNLPMYFLGSQGPDLFFFSKAAFMPGSLRKYGNRLHHEYVLENLMLLREAAKQIPELASYYYGFLCHYGLDSIAHPLIIDFAKQQHDSTGVDETEAHFEFEAQIDIHTLHVHQKSIEDYAVYKELNVDEKSNRILSAYYTMALKRFFDVDLKDEQMQACIRDIVTYSKALRPTSTTKYQIARALENLVKIPHLATGMMLLEKDASFDGVETYLYQNKNFPTLYEEAITQTLIYFEHWDPSDIVVDFTGQPLK